MTNSGYWQAAAQAKQAERASKIPKEWTIPLGLYEGRTNMMNVPQTCGILNEEELDITSNYDATALLENLHAGTLSAETVATAFCKRAAIAQQLTNCLTEIFFQDAIARAKQLDASRAANPSVSLPPLWGLPISLKDSFQVPGLDYSCGIASLVNDPSTVYSTLPKMLVDLGAILYVKTNVPQTLMTADSENNVFGRTVNPHNTSLTAGGSTGGEGALIALRGSVLGVGTDIAGSVRIPSLCNGIYALRPSNHVIPYSGQRRISVPGVEGVKGVAGPMSVSVRDCELFMRVVVKANPWEHDSAVNRTFWRGLEPLTPEQVTIGLVEDYGHVTPHPPVARALRESVGKLKRAGVKVVPITLPDLGKGYNNLFRFFHAPGNAPLRKMLLASGEPEVTSVQRLNMVDDERPPYPLPDYLELFVAREEAQTKLREIYVKHGLDAMMSPGAPYVALPHDKYTDVAFTGLWNYLDCPASIVPVGKVNERDVMKPENGPKYGKYDEDIYRLYTGPSDFKNAPTAIQIIGKRQHDEELLAITALIDDVLKS